MQQWRFAYDVTGKVKAVSELSGDSHKDVMSLTDQRNSGKSPVYTLNKEAVKVVMKERMEFTMSLAGEARAMYEGNKSNTVLRAAEIVEADTTPTGKMLMVDGVLKAQYNIEYKMSNGSDSTSDNLWGPVRSPK